MIWIVIKELAVFFADRSGAFLTLVVPTALAALVGMLFAPPSNPGLEVVIVDADQTPGSRYFIEQLSAANLKLEPVDLERARTLVGTGKKLGIVLPKGTGAALSPAALLSGAPPPALRLLRDPVRRMEGRMLKGALAQASLMTILRERPNSPMPEGFARIVERLKDGEVLPIEEELLGRTGSPANYHSYAHAFAGMICMFLLFAGQSAARRLVEEREAGTLHRLRLSAVHPHMVLAGVGVASAIIALLASALAYTVGVLGFGIPIHDPVGFGAVLLGQAVCVGGFALLLAGFGRTGRQVDGIGTFAVLVMSFAGGAWLPSFLMPDWLRTVALSMPTHWTTEGLAAMTWRAESLGVGLMYAGVLIGFGGLFAVIGIWRFRFE